MIGGDPGGAGADPLGHLGSVVHRPQVQAVPARQEGLDELGVVGRQPVIDATVSTPSGSTPLAQRPSVFSISSERRSRGTSAT